MKYFSSKCVSQQFEGWESRALGFHMLCLYIFSSEHRRTLSTVIPHGNSILSACKTTDKLIVYICNILRMNSNVLSKISHKIATPWNKLEYVLNTLSNITPNKKGSDSCGTSFFYLKMLFNLTLCELKALPI